MSDKTKKKQHGFNESEVRHRLEMLAEIAYDLSKNLGASGRPLNSDEKDVLKMVKLQMVSRQMDEIKYFLMAGHVEDAISGLGFLQETVREDW